jgi:hypothetical protein
MATHRGSCHCGRIAYALEADIGDVVSCNCSMCQRRGTLLFFVPRTAVTMETPLEDASVYTFNRHAIHHHFCPTCGCAPISFGTDPKGNATAAINARCIEGIEITNLKIIAYDGRSK